jgi:hypothetical protein
MTTIQADGDDGRAVSENDGAGEAGGLLNLSGLARRKIEQYRPKTLDFPCEEIQTQPEPDPNQVELPLP